MMDSQRTVETIPILVFGKTLTCTITQYTRCDDVIKMATGCRSLDCTTFAVYESAYGVERQLSTRTRLQKLVRSWGVDRHKFSLLVREIDPIRAKKINMSRVQRKLRKLRSALVPTRKEFETKRNCKEPTQDNINRSDHEKGNLYTKHIDIKQISQHKPASSGKMELMKRFLRDTQEYRHSWTNHKNGNSTHARDNSYLACSDDDTDDSVLDNAFIHHCRAKDDSDESDCSLNDTVLYRYPTSVQNRCPTSVQNNDKNNVKITNCDMRTFHGNGVSYEDVTSEELECSFDSSPDRKVSSRTVAEIRDIFSNVCSSERKSYDKDLESFMKTIVQDSASDEGLSSMGSDVI